jgi:hypothetical protein
MATGGVIVQPDAARTAAIPSQQVRRHTAFIEKHVLAYIAQRLPAPPAATIRRDVRPALFIGVYGFF